MPRTASIKTSVRVEGFVELDKALAELPKATARNVLKRILLKAGQPIAEAAAANAPKDTLELSQSIAVSSRIKNTTGNAEFAAAMRAGLGQAAAVTAMRNARRAAGGKGSFAEVAVGPGKAKDKAGAIKRIVQEFGSIYVKGTAYMRRAWEAKKYQALEVIKAELGDEIIRTAKRVAKNAARRAAKIKAGV